MDGVAWKTLHETVSVFQMPKTQESLWKIPLETLQEMRFHDLLYYNVINVQDKGNQHKKETIMGMFYLYFHKNYDAP